MFRVPPERSLDPVTLEVLRQVDHIAQELVVDYFVVGAIARDILLTGVFGLETGRATGDVAVGIVVEGWTQFDAIKAGLVRTGVFGLDEWRTQRLYHRPDPKGASFPLDLIPFGGVERRPHEIAWPPDGSVVMNVTGYSEAISSAVPVEVVPGFIVRVVSLPGLAILKLLAWADRGAGDSRDASDLATLLRRYAAAGNEDRIYGAEIRVLENTNYDFDLAGARLLGRDAWQIAHPATRRLVLAMLNDPARLERLALDVARELRATEDSVARAGELLAEFKSGFQEF
jgi:predicted nucleotidyltransferase